MEAHRLSEKCQLAGAIVSDKAHKFIFSVFGEPKGYHSMYSQLIVECDVPTGISLSFLSHYCLDHYRTISRTTEF